MNPRAGGAEKTIDEIGKRLVKFGHDFYLYTSRWRGSIQYQELNGVKIFRPKGNIMSHLLHESIIKSVDNFDVIVDDLGHVIPWLSERYSRVPGVVLFRHLHARTLRGQVNPISRVILQSIESKYGLMYKKWPFIAESKIPRLDLINLGIAESRIKIIKPGIDLDKFHPSGRKNDGQIIYFAGMRNYKRPDHVVKAFSLIQRKYDAKLKMVGDGPSFKTLKKLVDRLDLNKSVTFTGRLNESDLIRTLSDSSLNMHASVEEGWCYAPLEAAACAVPTSAYFNSGLQDEIIDGVTGKLSEDGNIEKLAINSLEILENLNDYSNNAFIHSHEFSWYKSALEWEKTLEEVIENG